MADIEVGIAKSARRGYRLDDIAIVPSRRTRDREDVDLSWQLDAFKLPLPLIVAAMDAVVSPASAIAIGKLGGLAVLNLEGLWTRYEDPEPLLAEIGALDDDKVTARLQEIYAEPIKLELVTARIAEISQSGVVACGSVSPQRARELVPAAMKGELDVLAIMGTVVSAEHVSKTDDPLNLKTFIRDIDVPVIVGGCASYQAALHLMRTGAVGIVAGVSSGEIGTTASILGIAPPQATVIADAAAARSRHLEETGVYVHIIASGGMRTGGDIAKAIACGADAVMMASPLAAATEAPGRGAYWGMAASHPTLPRGRRVTVPVVGTFEDILFGPAHNDDGYCNLFGALRASMALCGYANVREFHKADVVVSPPSSYFE